MNEQAKWIAGNLIQTQFMVRQNFDSILPILEDVVVGVVMTAATSPHSNMVGNAPEAILSEFTKRVLGKIGDLGPMDVGRIVEAAVKAQQHEREARAKAEDQEG
jgi:hypothetical protein